MEVHLLRPLSDAKTEGQNTYLGALHLFSFLIGELSKPCMDPNGFSLDQYSTCLALEEETRMKGHGTQLSSSVPSRLAPGPPLMKTSQVFLFFVLPI